MFTKLIDWLTIPFCLILVCIASAISLFQEEKIDTTARGRNKP
ncbi:hypothetical protein [Spirosoma koreense]